MRSDSGERLGYADYPGNAVCSYNELVWSAAGYSDEDVVSRSYDDG